MTVAMETRSSSTLKSRAENSAVMVTCQCVFGEDSKTIHHGRLRKHNFQPALMKSLCDLLQNHVIYDYWALEPERVIGQQLKIFFSIFSSGINHFVF